MFICRACTSPAAIGCHCVGLDWSINIGDAKKRIGEKVALQGNLDPAFLYANPEKIRDEVSGILSGFGNGSGHVFNLGHGISQHVNPDNVKVLVDAVHELSIPYHRN